jgi:hypothetical protein
MKMIDKETRRKIQGYLDFLQENYEIENDYTNYFDEDEEEIPDEFEDEDIVLDFPQDYDGVSYSSEEFLDYMSDIDSLVEVDKTTVRTNHIRQTVISSRYQGWDLFEGKLRSFGFDGDFYTVNIVSNPFLIGLVNAKNGNCDQDYGVYCCLGYTALELKYKDERRLSKEEEDQLLERITFFLTKALGTAVYISEVIDMNQKYDYYSVVEDDDEGENDNSSDTIVKVSDLMAYNPMMKLYKQALAAEDEEIKFLQYYKIVEYISPIVAKLTAYDKLNKRLDLLATSARNHEYLDSIFSITRKYDQDMKDDYLAISVIQTCVDVLPLWQFVPERLRKQIRKNLSLKGDSLDDTISDEQLASLQKQIARMLYSTRNSIVHAKSNYEPNGYELKGDELEDGNKMMDMITMSIIQWNERQPESYKV